MADFLAENNVCGQIILKLVSRGNAIISELLRLKDYIPKLYSLETKAEMQKFGDIIMDFTYFEVSESQDSKIEQNEVLLDLDEEHRNNHIEIITRFYVLFESIHMYIIDLNHFLEQVEEGVYIHQTLDTIFMDMEGKQVLCESLYLYGLMLLLVDVHIKGIIRERLLVSYYRYTPQRSDTHSCIDEVCKLLRDTGLCTKKPISYPEDYFGRISLHQNFVDMVIGHLRSDDIYGQLPVYPLPKHRSTALANQASMLFICLYFSPNILHAQTAIMREIVDKYFPDNWVISVYMGHTINLIESWEPFKAAKLALNNTLELVNIKNYSSIYGSNLPKLLKSSGIMLKEGNITKETLLRDITNIINLLRECNATLRWLMLHTIVLPGKIDRYKKCKQLRELVIAESKFDNVQLFKLLLNTAQLELITKDVFKSLLAEKEQQWNDLKTESFKSVVELSEVFSGNKPLSRIKKNENLEKWFLEISKEIESLNNDDLNSSRKIVQLIQALEEVQEFHQLESNMQIVQFLTETRKYLNQMIQTINIKEDNLITIQVITDVSFAWELIDSYTPIMQLGIEREPTLVIKLRAIFLKLASALEIPLLRINQAHSEDLVSVSQYFSSELEIYVRKVLQIIPKMMFEKMSRIIEMQTIVLKELPTRLDKDKLKDFAQLDERFEFAQLTHSISVFSQGMRMMKSTLVGVVCLDPKKLLEDGIRNELVQHISKTLHSELIFSTKAKGNELETKIKSLGRIIDGFKRSFEYIQDYININGLKIWQEEVTRIINYNVEQECNGFLRSKVHAWESEYQNRFVPIPVYPRIDNVSENFIGRLAREIIRITEPRNSVYMEQTTTWYDIKTHKPILNMQTIASMTSAIEVAGLVGLDRLFSFMIITNLQKLSGFLQNKETKRNTWHTILTNLYKEIKPDEFVSNPNKFYQTCINRTTKLWADFIDSILLVGQLQLLRKLIAFHLNLSCKFNAKNLEASLQALNKALLIDIKNEKYSPSEELMFNLSPYFDYSGMNNAFNKIYVTSPYNESYSITMFIFVIAHVNKLFHPGPLGAANKKGQDLIDGYTFALGVHTVLKQFHHNLNDVFIKLICKYVTEYSTYHKSLKNGDTCSEIVTGINFLETYANFSCASRTSLRAHMPDEILHLEQTVCTFNG